MTEFGVRELERVLVDALAPTPSAVLIDSPDWVQLTTPSRPAPNRNGVYLARLRPARADERIAEVIKHYRQRGASFRWVVGPSSEPSDLSARLERAGVPKIAVALGMTMRVPPTPTPAPAGLELREVGPDDLDLYADLSARAWVRGPAFERECRDFMARALARGGGILRSWLAYRDGEAVACSTLHLLPDLGYFQGASVLPSHRHQGIYGALLHHRLELLRGLGIERAVVWADEATSAGVCQRVGFEALCRATFHEQIQSEPG